MDIGNTLRAFRAKADVSQWELARLSGVSWASIARIELGRQDPSLGTLERLAEGLGVSVVDLVKEAVGTGRMKMQRKRKGRPSKTKGED